MRLRRFLCLVLLCAVTCCALFSVSVYASAVKLPAVPTEFKNLILYDYEGQIDCFAFDDYEVIDGEVHFSHYSYHSLVNGEWVPVGVGVFDRAMVFSPNDVGDGLVYIYDSTGVLPIAYHIEFDKPVGYSEIVPVVSAYIDQINVQQIVIVLAAAAGVSIGLVFLWWGARKVIGVLMKAFKKGKIRI